MVPMSDWVRKSQWMQLVVYDEFFLSRPLGHQILTERKNILINVNHYKTIYEPVRIEMIFLQVAWDSMFAVVSLIV